MAASLTNLATFYFEFNKAEPLLVRALPIQEEKLGEDHADTVINIATLASVYVQNGNPIEGERFLKCTLSIQEVSLVLNNSPNDPVNSTRNQTFKKGH